MAKLTLSHGRFIRVILPLFWFTKLILVSIQRAESVLDKNTTTVGYIFSKYVHCDMRFLVEKNRALLCSQGGFGIAVPVYSY